MIHNDGLVSTENIFFITEMSTVEWATLLVAIQQQRGLPSSKHTGNKSTIIVYMRHSKRLSHFKNCSSYKTMAPRYSTHLELQTVLKILFTQRTQDK
jgi:hypothetical protein